MKAFENNIAAHIAVYGPDNHLRLTGLHETQAIDKFSYGLSDRGASVRLPVNFIKNGYKGYLEDRRPNSEGDPYQIVSRILKTINSVPKPELVSRMSPVRFLADLKNVGKWEAPAFASCLAAICAFHFAGCLRSRRRWSMLVGGLARFSATKEIHVD